MDSIKDEKFLQYDLEEGYIFCWMPIHQQPKSYQASQRYWVSSNIDHYNSHAIFIDLFNTSHHKILSVNIHDPQGKDFSKWNEIMAENPTLLYY